jgi:hypothetical protein
MGREVRRVPKGWEHPKDDKGDLAPLHGHSFSKALDDWNEESYKWLEGLRKKYTSWDTLESFTWVKIDEEYKNMSYSEYAGECPAWKDYMPEWPIAEKTHLQMYETCTEGTPISPVMATPEELAKWLADNGASAFGSETASYEAWLKVCKGVLY